jgi:vancomycin resistance protein VanJ
MAGAKIARWAGGAAIGGSALFLVFLVTCFIARWDAVAVLTLPPFWAWGLMGCALTLVALRLRGGWLVKAVLAGWVVATVGASDDLFCLLRSPVMAMGARVKLKDPKRLRVVCLNCASQAKAAEETRVWRPDIVLLQESPSSNDVARLCHEWFGGQGGFLFGFDCSIVSWRPIRARARPHSTRYIWGEIELPTGPPLEVVSMRLNPPDTRFDMWSGECWKQHAAGRRLRRSQLEEALKALAPGSIQGPLILGGDFNVAAGDAVFRSLAPFAKDCFREAGLGWGNTAINDCPVARPDQVWINHASTAIRAWVRMTENSDHRMVVCEVIPEEKGPGRGGTGGQ